MPWREHWLSVAWFPMAKILLCWLLIPWSAHDNPAMKAEKLLESLKGLPISKGQ
jgi:hypothetical protein